MLLLDFIVCAFCFLFPSFSLPFFLFFSCFFKCIFLKAEMGNEDM